MTDGGPAVKAWHIFAIWAWLVGCAAFVAYLACTLLS